MSWEFATKTLAEDVPGFEIIRETGEGAMGRVFVARQIALDRLVALKFLATDPDDDTGERIARFRREAAIMAALKHPNVLPVFDFGEDDGRFFLAMEYVEGGDLRKRMPVGRGMRPAETLAILIPVGEALDYLHAEGILHRDLKPENILMQGDVPKVADFGIAVERSGSGELTRSGQGLGTLGYVAPELQYRLPVDERADQYSLAAMTYEMLTGVRPLGLFKAPSFHNPCLSQRVDQVLLRGLEESPSDRYPSVLAFVYAVRDSFDTKEAIQAKKRNRQFAGTAAMVLLLAAIVTAISWIRPDPSAPPLPKPQMTLRSPEPSAMFQDLVKWESHRIWLSQGKPMKAEGAAVAPFNWEKATLQVRKEVDILTQKLWNERNHSMGPIPTAESSTMCAEAERLLYQKWQVDPSKFVEDKNAGGPEVP